MAAHPARTDDVVRSIGRSFAAAGWTGGEVTGSDRPVVSLRTSEFRWRWMATRLHTVAVTVPLRPGEDRAWLDAALATTVENARRELGSVPLGFQSGIAVVATVVGDGVDPALHDWALRPHGGAFAVVVQPVLADVATGQVSAPATRRVGAVYHPYLRDLVARHVTPQVQHAATAGPRPV